MEEYFVCNKVDFNGRHIVHKLGCTKMPRKFQRIDLGEHYTGIQAVEYCQKNYFPDSDGCELCCEDGHYR